jgi:hypothetical protein
LTGRWPLDIPIRLRDATAKILDGTTRADVRARVAMVGRGPGSHVTTGV